MIIDCSFLIVSNCQPGEGEEEADMQTPSKWKQEAAGQACLDTHYVLPLPLFLCDFELCGGLACMVPS